MGNPFIEYQEPDQSTQNESQSGHMTSDSDPVSDVLSQCGNMNLATATLPAVKSSPMQDALHAAETYFQQLERRSNGRYDPPRTMFESLVDESQNPAGFVRTKQRTSIDDGHSKLLAETDGNTSPTQATCDLRVPSEFSLDDSDDVPYESIVSPRAVFHSNESKENVALGRDSANFPVGNYESFEFCSFQGFKESSTSPLSETTPSKSGEFEHLQVEDHPSYNIYSDGGSKSTFEWNADLKRSSKARSRDSASDESFKFGRSDESSISSRNLMTDEGISERVAEWGHGVARLVLKNSSRDPTPRSSNASSADGFHYTHQKVPKVSKQIKDALSAFKFAFWICDAVDPENPILYASDGFIEMTGYSPEEVIGRNCLFLRGVGTEANELARVREALKKGYSTYTGTFLNYKKNGAPFWNLLTLTAISNDKGVVIKYMGMQAEVGDHSVEARQKRLVHNINCKDIPKSPSQSIAETASPLDRPVERSERQGEIPVFTHPGARLSGTTDRNGRSQGRERYSLTIGPKRSIECQGSRRYSSTREPRHSMDSGHQRRVGGSERHSLPTGIGHSLAPQQRVSKTASAARPFYWLMTAARILEQEMQHLGSDTILAKDLPATITVDESPKGGVKNKHKIGRVAKGLFALFRNLERKLLKRKQSSVPPNRVNDYHSDSEIDDLPELPTMNDFPNNFYGPDLRCESMPHIDSIANTLRQANVRVRSNRFASSAVPDRFYAKNSA